MLLSLWQQIVGSSIECYISHVEFNRKNVLLVSICQHPMPPDTCHHYNMILFSPCWKTLFPSTFPGALCPSERQANFHIRTANRQQNNISKGSEREIWIWKMEMEMEMENLVLLKRMSKMLGSSNLLHLTVKLFDRICRLGLGWQLYLARQNFCHPFCL